MHRDDEAAFVAGAVINGVAATLTVEDESDRLLRFGRPRGLGWREAWASFAFQSDGDCDVQRFDENIFDGERFAVGLKAFEVDGDGFAQVGDGLVECVALGMTAGQGGAGGVIAAARICLKNSGVSLVWIIAIEQMVR